MLCTQLSSHVKFMQFYNILDNKTINYGTIPKF